MPPSSTQKGARRYPWDKWLRRKAPFRLYRLKDYGGTDYQFSQLARQRARRYGGRLSIMIDVGSVLITVTTPIGDEVVFERNRPGYPKKPVPKTKGAKK